MGRTLLVIGLGGGLGSIARYLLAFYVSKNYPSAFPYGTLLVNLLGCLLIGLVFGLSEKYQWMTGEWRIFLTVGFCGGFTTFSAFAIENVRLLQEGLFLNFVLYTLLSLGVGLLAVVGGFYLSRL